MYTVVYIEAGWVREDQVPHKVSGVHCTLSPHKRRVSSRDFEYKSDAQSYADTIAPSRKAFVIELPKEYKT